MTAAAETVASQPLKVLVVEDNSLDADLEIRELKRAAIHVEHRVAESEAQLRETLQTFRPDVILCDLGLRDMNGVKAIRIAREIDPNVPAIIVTGSVTEQQAVIALQSGAVDYVLKSNLQRLSVAVLRAVEDAAARKQHSIVRWRLDQAREQLANIAETVESVLSSYSVLEKRFTYVSAMAEHVYGYGADAFMANAGLWKELVYEPDRDMVRRATRCIFEDGQYDVDYRIVHASGQIRWVSHRARLSRDFDGEPVRVDSVLVDITRHMEAQQRLSRLSRIRYVLSSVNAAIVRIRDQAELFEEACRIAVDAGGFMNAYVVEVDFDARTAAMPAFLGQSDREDALARLMEFLPEDRCAESATLESIRCGRPSVRNDLPQRGRRARIGVRSAASFPLVVDDRSVGAFIVESDIPNLFDDDEVELLSNLTNNLSFALELLDKQSRVDYLSYYDALTQLPNRTLFHDRLDQDVAAARAAGKMLAVVLIDISRFAALNSLGEHIGDQVLRKVADRLREIVGETNVARVAGDRFAVRFSMLEDLRPVTDVLTEDGIRFFDTAIALPDRELHVMARAGCSVFPNDGADAETLFQNAEAALLSAKSSGGTYRFYARDLNARLAKRLELEARLQRAIDEQQFVLYYQPKIDLTTQAVVGFEALIRWNDPERGLVAPGDFIPLLEETGMIIPVGRWAMAEAVRQYEEWRNAGLNPPRVAVNLSALQLRHERLVDDVRTAVLNFGAECGLDLEITESMLMENIDTAIAKLTEIRNLGVELSLDDFGTGYSSLAYISRLPLNALKIDRSFVVGMLEDAGKTAIITSIVSLAQAMRLKVIAEGVEHAEEARLLRLLRCDQVQGYLTGRPQPADEAMKLLCGAG